MKKYIKYILLSSIVVVTSSCKKFLDINTDPNNLTSASAALILPQAITNSALIANNSSQSMSDFGGFQANAGGFGGFGSVVTYDYGTGNFNGLWIGTYDNAYDFEYIINNTANDLDFAYSTAIARIMKSLDFERLVNQYNDAPYSDALKGPSSLQPKYDKAEAIYKACIAELNKAIADISTAQTKSTTIKIAATTDPLFSGNMDLWKKFANTIKLRMLIKMAEVPAEKTYATAGFAAIDRTLGFLITDAINQPTYEKTTRPSPVYSSIGFSATGNNVNTSRIPSRWIYSFYNGNKLTDPGRGGAIYRNFPSTPINQLGDESAGVPPALATGSSWFTGDNAVSSTFGVVKGPGQGVPVMLAAESYFLQAEAFARNYLSGDAAAAYNNGILQSFTYIYKNASNVLAEGKNPVADVATYLLNNETSSLVNFSLAVSMEQKIEAIITQKYIAFNMIANDEAFNEFRRTGYPKIVNGSLNPLLTFASRQSISTRADKLPARILYPQQEYNLNPANAPAGIDKFGSRIFYDLN